MNKLPKKEYLVQAPHLSGPCTVKKLKPEHKVLRVRDAPVCPNCGNDETYWTTWDETKGFCPLCHYRIGDEIKPKS